jgi:hypothetical protein
MKTLASLLLLFQLQPLFGIAACLGFSDAAAQQECEMPEHGPMPLSTLAPNESPAPNCVLASVCTPSPLAIVSLAESLESVIPIPPGSPTMVAVTLFGISSAPPFHPPRA